VSDVTGELVAECKRQYENCAYTAATFHIWLRWLRGCQIACNVIAVIFGALAAWNAAKQSWPALAAVSALLATAIPIAYRASKADERINEYMTLAAEFTNLRDRFRQAALIWSQKPLAEFEAATKQLFERHEKARQHAVTPPEWAFLSARRKFEQGHYTLDYDLKEAA